ncbi:hypothetical protein [Bradyrhizobium diazoefficiens]|uniref:Uncharacterized protein n=1 Tax=Bradyrhizobium diazoefficiens TaxID=1355477 RepID=A0A810C8K2_9BRAD|nr:hypothetical protein XF9B_52210 [Bradyrhizobium diazoefficiens]
MVKREEFSLFGWSMAVPLCDDLWLGMQLRNIAVVDLSIIRPMEAEILELWYQTERTPPEIMMLTGISQMWLFSLYEFLRTWRQKAKHIIKVADEYETVQPRKREKFLKGILDVAESKHKFVQRVPRFYVGQLQKIPNADFVKSVRDYLANTEELFTHISHARMMLAKHEIMGAQGFMAEAPGYGRLNTFSGSIYWQYTLKDESLDVLDRRSVANTFLGIDESEMDSSEPHEEEPCEENSGQEK